MRSGWRFAASTVFAAACCQAPPEWAEIAPMTVADGVDVQVQLSAYATGNVLTFEAEADPGVVVSVLGDVLTVTGEPGFVGYSTITLLARDQCGQETATHVEVEVSDRERTDACSIRVTAVSSASSVSVAGSFNDWSSSETPMEKQTDGTWAVDILLPAGEYPYKLVEGGAWRCDPERATIQCDEGQAYDPTCPTGGNTCNSMLVVPDCRVAQLSVTNVNVDKPTGSLEVDGKADRKITEGWATLDGEPVDGWDGSTFHFATSGLSAGRHTLRFGADNAEPMYVPLWTDDRDWSTGLLYFAFVDRFADGDATLNAGEGADVDYAGGDWAGLRSKLDYLDDLGVTVLWITAPLDNAEGAWDGQCGATYAGYHGYWPHSDRLEEHFGDEAELQALVADAHARGMRVMVDWVANHVHRDHDWYQTRPEWFNEEHLCVDDDDGDGVVNWDQRPESCWFAEYLPDIDYAQTEPLAKSVDAAIDFAKTWEIDGYRIDAVKHMPHSVVVNAQTRIREEIEHTDAGGTEDFRTIGETFDGREKIASYLGDAQLDAQFDFPLYYAVVQAFARDEIGLSNGDGSLASAVSSSNAAYGGASMSTFLGNHDVERFIAQASGEVSSLGGDSPCGDDGSLHTADTAPGYPEPYERLRLAWTFLLTSPGLPLIYNGDEIGLPGYADPDNRQEMRFGNDLSADEAETLAHVQALGQARREHPAFALGTTVGWWENEPEVWAYARAYQDDAVLVLLNRGDGERTLQNGVAFAGLAEGTYVDILTGDTFSTSGDSLSVSVPAHGSRVLVPR